MTNQPRGNRQQASIDISGDDEDEPRRDTDEQLILLPKIRRRQKIDRYWINIGSRSEDELEEDDEMIEFADAEMIKHGKSIRQSEAEGIRNSLNVNAAVFERLKNAANDYDREKRRSTVGHFDLHARPSQISGTLPIEWYTFRFGGLAVGFDLEMWWRRSGTFIRINAFFLVLLLILFVANFLAGVFLFYSHFTQRIQNPYVCTTPDCQQATKYMLQDMNMSVDPCDNFYEFMCGTYYDMESGNKHYRQLVNEPGFKIELGADSLISKILKDFRNDKTYDQSIEYYQSCLDEDNKRERGITTLIDKIENIFGTRDFSTFSVMTTPSYEEITLRLYKTVGHAYYLNMAFTSFPIVQLILPSERVAKLASYTTWPKNPEYVTNVFNFLMPNLEIEANSSDITEMVNAIGFWSNLTRSLYTKLLDVTNVEVRDHSQFTSKMASNFAGMCPPLGVKLDYLAVLKDFLRTDFHTIEYFDLTSEKYWKGLLWCFDQPVTGFDFQRYKLTPDKRRLAFVSVWILGLLQDLMVVMDHGFVFNFFNGSDPEVTKNSGLVRSIFRESVHLSVEHKCIEELWKSLGYLPSLRYVQEKTEDPVEFIKSSVEEILELYKSTRELFWAIPKEEINRFLERIGNLILHRELHVDLLMPLIGETLDTFRELLNFKEDHLENHFIALNLTVESGRQYWLGSTDPVNTPKWWGYGGPSALRDQLLDLRYPFLEQARFQEEDHAFARGKWEIDFGRKDFNYILFSLALFNEPHITETLALKSGGYTLKLIRTILSLVGHVTVSYVYPTYNDRPEAQRLEYRAKMRGDDSDYNPEYPVNDETCETLRIPKNDYDENEEGIYEYSMQTHKIQDLSSNDYEEVSNTFFTIMTVKIAFKLFKERRKQILSQPYNSHLSRDEKKFRMHRRLPGEMEKYTEEQLFFMIYVRHLCMMSWKKAEPFTRSRRYALEVDVLNSLMQSEEFQKVWKCKKDSFMNNKGSPKCFKWVP